MELRVIIHGKELAVVEGNAAVCGGEQSSARGA